MLHWGGSSASMGGLKDGRAEDHTGGLSLTESLVMLPSGSGTAWLLRSLYHVDPISSIGSLSSTSSSSTIISCALIFLSCGRGIRTT